MSGFTSRSRSRPRRSWRGAEAETERRRVARGQRHRRDDRERPGETGALGRGRRAPGALVDEQDVGLLVLDRLLEVSQLEARPLAELAETRAERAEPRPRPPVVRLEPLDLTPQGLRVEPDRAQPLDIVDPTAHRDAMAAPAPTRAASSTSGYSRPGTASTYARTTDISDSRPALRGRAHVLGLRGSALALSAA